MNADSFRDKTVVITGASAGVGAACARAFSAHRAKLVLIARGEEALAAIAKSCVPKQRSWRSPWTCPTLDLV